MRKIEERNRLYAEIRDEVRITGKASKQHVELMQSLMEDEVESLEKAQLRMNLHSLSDASRRQHETSVANRELAISCLEKAINRAPKSARAVVSCLEEILENAHKRGRKSAKPENTLNKLYQTYLVQEDRDFHDWLQRNGHTDSLKELGITPEV